MTSADMPAMPTFVAPMLDGGVVEGQYGLTKREYFAAMALQGLLVNAERNGLTFNNAHVEAVTQADALLAELEK